MSYRALRYVKKLRIAPNGEKITKDEKLVLLHLADAYGDDSELAWPSVKTIAQDCGLSENTARSLLYDLRDKGGIEMIPPPKKGRGYGYSYRFPELDAPQKRARKARIKGPGKGQKASSKAAGDSSANKEVEQETENRRKRPTVGNQFLDGLNQKRGQQVWPAVLEYLKANENKHSFEVFVEPLKPAGWADGVLWICAPSQFAGTIERYREPIRTALSLAGFTDITDVRFECR